MGIIAPKEIGTGSKVLLILFAISLFPILIVWVLLYLLWGGILCVATWLTWGKRQVLFVYSDSSIWKGYIEKEIIPYIEDKAILLNWSERKSWKASLAVSAFRYFGGHRNFNPMGIVFRPFHFVKTYRFFQAFKKFKHGNPGEVEEVKNKLFENLGI